MSDTIRKKGNYTETEILDMLLNTIKENTPFYSKRFINYRGKTKDTKVKYTEIIAKYILNNIDVISCGIQSVTRGGSYKTDTHDGIVKNQESNRIEETYAINMKGKTYDIIGEVLDYQVPLKNKKSDISLGKIDLISYERTTNSLFLHELKKQTSKETLLKCVLEIYTYYQIINKDKLKNDFELPMSQIYPAVLVFNDGPIHKEYELKHPYITKLIEKLNTKIFLLGDNYRVVKN